MLLIVVVVGRVVEIVETVNPSIRFNVQSQSASQLKDPISSHASSVKQYTLQISFPLHIILVSQPL